MHSTLELTVIFFDIQGEPVSQQVDFWHVSWKVLCWFNFFHIFSVSENENVEVLIGEKYNSNINTLITYGLAHLFNF